MAKPRAPDFTVHTPALATKGKQRWVKIGAAWTSRSAAGIPYVSIVLDLMPVQGVLTLFPVGEQPSEESVPPPGDADAPFR